jgi:mutator protein MutT
MDALPVVCAIIENSEGKILVARKRAGLPLEGFWEFPGGKKNKGETLEQALVRELDEELGVSVRLISQLSTSLWTSSRGPIELTAFHCTEASGNFTLRDHDAIAWVDPHEAMTMKLAPADIPLLESFITKSE